MPRPSGACSRESPPAAIAAGCWAEGVAERGAALERNSEEPIVLALGSNVAPGREIFDKACVALEACGVHVLKRSRIYRADPWGKTDQPEFLNAAILVATEHPPEVLLEICLEVERSLGRERHERWG